MYSTLFVEKRQQKKTTKTTTTTADSQLANKKAQLTQGVTRDSAIIPRWPSAAILDIIEPEIAPFDPPTPKALAQN